jgi:hypothetical protein
MPHLILPDKCIGCDLWRPCQDNKNAGAQHYGTNL